MAREDFQRKSRRSSDYSYFQNEIPPQPFADPVTGQLQWKPGTGRYITGSSSDDYALERGYRVSVSTPGFLGPKRPSILKANYFKFIRVSESSSGYLRQKSVVTSPANGPGSSGYEDYTSSWSGHFSLGYLSVNTQSLRNRLRAKAITKLLASVKNQSINVAQAVAERQQTIDLVTSTAKKIHGCVTRLRAGDIIGAASQLGVTAPRRARRRFKETWIVDQSRAVANGWLSLQFGWKPLLSDAYGTVETLATQRANRDTNTIFGTGSGKASETTNETNRIDHDMAGGKGAHYTAFSTDSLIAVRCGCVFIRSSPRMANLAQIGITNPLLIAWELTPWSFVVDWFLPIGSFLSSLDATLGLSFYSGYITTFERHHETASKVTDFLYRNGYKQSSGKAFETRKTVVCEREVLTGFPSPQIPSFKNPLSFSHLASAMALLRQLRGK